MRSFDKVKMTGFIAAFFLLDAWLALSLVSALDPENVAAWAPTLLLGACALLFGVESSWVVGHYASKK